MTETKRQIILCVDDDKKNLALLEALLAPRGYDLRFAGSGEEALKCVATELPDLILLDIMMPGVSGSDGSRKTEGRGADTSHSRCAPDLAQRR